jgi:hypothetical protein
MLSQNVISDEKFDSLEINKSTISEMKHYLGDDFIKKKRCEVLKKPYGLSYNIRVVTYSYYYEKSGITVFYIKNRGRLFRNMFFRHKLYIPIHSIKFEYPFSGCTDLGIKIGDTYQSVIDMYGFNVVENNTLDYPAEGISFVFDENNKKVISIIIRKIYN